MYTLEDVVNKGIRILCPEEWQRDAFIEYSENVLKDMGWKGVKYHQYGSKTYFYIEKLSDFGFDIEDVYGDYVTLYGEYYPEVGLYIDFEEFDISMSAVEIDMSKFENFLLGD